MNISVADKILIGRILQRKDKSRHFAREIHLGEVLKEILSRANEFVPSDSGAILLDDPLLKWSQEERGKLYFVACFGHHSLSLVGTSLNDDAGIAGKTYKCATPYLSKDVKKDKFFSPEIDRMTNHETRSVIAVPIKIQQSVIGVLELVNRKDKVSYSGKDLAILEIFARYTSTLVANALDGLRFEELSKKDNLTGLYNDRYFYERLAVEVGRAVENGEPVSMIFFDLDRFKEVNDTYGHLSGSRVLKEVARLVEEILVGSSAVPARFGGDEYVIILPATDINKAAKIAEKIRSRIANNTFIKEESGSEDPPLNISGVITCSIGVSSFAPPFHADVNRRKIEEKIIKAADYAMYKSKELGKNRVTLAPDLSTIKK